MAVGISDRRYRLNQSSAVSGACAGGDVSWEFISAGIFAVCDY